jgi:hypothetical protein
MVYLICMFLREKIGQIAGTFVHDFKQRRDGYDIWSASPRMDGAVRRDPRDRARKVAQRGPL